MFVQGLIKEVAYGTLAKRDRRARHLAAARHFEALGDDELAGVLAQHYIEAYRAQPGGEEGAAVAAQARVTLRAAAARAKALASPAHALSYVELALEVTTDAADELALRREAGGFAAEAGKFDASVPHLERAIELATQMGDRVARRRAVGHLGNVLIEGHQDRAFELLSEAMAEPGLTPDDDGYVEIAEALAKLFMRRSRFAEAVALVERALPAAESRGLTVLAVEMLTTRAVSLSNINRPIESVASLMGVIAPGRSPQPPGPAAAGDDQPGVCARPGRPGGGLPRVARRGGQGSAVGPALRPALPGGQCDEHSHPDRRLGLGARERFGTRSGTTSSRPSGSGWERSRLRSSRLAASRWPS